MLETDPSASSSERSDSSDPQADSREAPDREVRYEHSRNFAEILSRLNCSVLVSTYQAGKLAAVGASDGKLTLSLHNFERAMGVAAQIDGPAVRKIAVGSQRQVWFLNTAPDIAPRLPPAGRHDACFLTRSAHFTGEIQIHELAFAGDELWCANTLFNCLCTLHADFSFVPKWRPAFVSAMAAEDRCHLNGFALGGDGKPAYVTVIAESDKPQGWRERKADGGGVIDVRSNQVVLRGLSMPHSPRVYRGNLYVLDSGRGRLLLVDAAKGNTAVIAQLPGYTRGMAIHGGHAFVGLSKIRETNVFGGLPIAEKRDELKCGVGVIELASGRLVSHLEFKTGVEEIFAVEVLPGVRCPALSGPYPHLDGTQTIWNAPAAKSEGACWRITGANS